MIKASVTAWLELLKLVTVEPTYQTAPTSPQSIDHAKGFASVIPLSLFSIIGLLSFMVMPFRSAKAAN